jgi:sugar phosphate isomerase/epimerase
MPAKIYLTLYTVQKDWNQDPIGTLEKVKEMGYEGVEFGLDIRNPALSDIAAKLQELNLPAVSTHINLDAMTAQGDEYFRWMEKLGIRFLVIPWLDDDRIPGGDRYPQTKEAITALLKRCEGKGITLSYHNHNFEFEKVNGVCKEDILLQDIPALKAQLDVCWCTVGGQVPAEYILHYGHRMPTLHLKDFSASQSLEGIKLFDLLGENDQAEAEKTRLETNFSFQPVGYGKVDFPAIFQAADAVGVKWMGVEQDASPDRPPIEAAELSLAYIRDNYL